MIGIPSSSGFWPDYYFCSKDNLVETINRMLREHASDFPITACGGFEIEEIPIVGYKIYPIVLRNSKDKS